MMDEETIRQINRGSFDPPEDAGPAWREAAALGLDMSLIESNLALSPWERLVQHDRSLAGVRELQSGQRLEPHGKVH